MSHTAGEPRSSSPGTALLICLWSSSPSSSCFPLPYSADGQIPAVPVLTHQPGSLACHCDPCFASVPCHLDSTVVLPLWLIAMSLDPKPVSALTVMASSSNVIPTTLYNTNCQLFLIPFAVDFVIHCASTWDPRGFRHHAPSDSRTLYIHENIEQSPP